MASVHLGGWEAAGEEVVGVFGVDDSATVILAQRSGAVICSTYEELLSRVDIVDICTPTYTHSDYAIAAASAGKHVVCEKPLALDPLAAQAVVHACEAAKVHLLVGQVVRFFPDYVGAKAQIDDGVIGQPSIVRLSRLTYLPSKGAGNWFHDIEKSGGLVYDLMIHDFDYARWVAGEVTQVFAKSVSSGASESSAAHVLVIMRHESGTLSHIEGSWMYPKPIFHTKAEIAGSQGLVQWDSLKDNPLRLMKEVGPNAAGVPAPRTVLLESPWVTELKHFAEVLRGDAEARVTALDALAAVRICAAVLESINDGSSVEVEQ